MRPAGARVMRGHDAEPCSRLRRVPRRKRTASAIFPSRRVDREARPRLGARRRSCDNRLVPPPTIRSWLLLAQREPPPRALLDAFAGAAIDVEHVTTRAALETVLSRQPMDVILADADFDGASIEAVQAAVARRSPGLPLVVMVDAAAVATAIDAVKAGARDYVIKPLVLEDVLFVVQKARMSAAASAARPPAAGASHVPGGRDLIGDSGAMRAIWALVARAAHTNATVLVGGETGTGKELVARRIHELSPRSAQAFVKIQCGALPDALLESELFGYEKGAFTGAVVRKPGRVELADKGTLFLDEIGDISAATQVKLLRILQDREYERLGGTETRRADVRFVAATHRDLPAMVARGEFREDLYYRLNVVRITLPPLRDRLEDLPALAHHFAALACRTNGLPPVALGDAAIAVLAAQRWPGNVRQLQNLIERLVVLSETPTIGPDDARRELGEAAALPGRDSGPIAAAEEPPEMSAIDLKGAVSRAERRQIEKALLKAKGSRDLAARLLGVSRRTFYYKLRLHGME
jgi:two-component system, NtrC family, response regulator AtoC